MSSTSSSTSESEIRVACNYCPKHADPHSDSFPTKCVLSNGAPCRACARQLELKAQIEETKKLLDRLIVEEHQARVEINQSHDPIQQLPPEIILYIFSFTLPAFTFQEKADQWPDPKHWKETRSETDVLTLGAVCQLWRNVAWSASRLWSDVMLALTREPTDNMIQVVHEWLQRSRDFPLSIRLYLGYHSGVIRDKDSDNDSVLVTGDQIQRFINLFNDHLSRWQDLSVQCDYELLGYFHGDQKGAGANHLETLQLIALSDGFAPESPVFYLGGVKPQPYHIITMGFPRLQFIGVSWNNATNVTVEYVTRLDCIQLLHDAPKLINLRLENVCHSGRLVVIPDVDTTTPLILPHLQTLYISTSIPFEDIIDSITLPSLKKLTIRGLNQHNLIQLPSRNVKRFFERSSCSLISFVLRYCTCKDQDIIRTIDSLPSSLKNLQLDTRIPHNTKNQDHDLPVLFKHISRFPSATSAMPSRSELLPNLETFKFHIFKRTQIPWPLLLNIPRPVFGERRPFRGLTIVQRFTYKEGHGAPLLITKSQNVDKSVVRGLLELQDDGIEFFLPRKVVRHDFLALLKDD